MAVFHDFWRISAVWASIFRDRAAVSSLRRTLPDLETRNFPRWSHVGVKIYIGALNGRRFRPNRSVSRPFFASFRRVFEAQSPIRGKIGVAENAGRFEPTVAWF